MLKEMMKYLQMTLEDNNYRRVLMNIGLIAHESKKKLMQNFCIAYRGILNKNQLIYD